MNSTLPTPTLQTGLMAYYTFDNLLNKQGNPAWNVTLSGSASINTINPNCNFIKDSCALKICSNIDSVRFNHTITSCSTFNFEGLGYTNSDPINSWQWYFGNGGTATTQNPSYAYTTGPFTVKLVATDINGCKDSISKDVSSPLLSMDAGPADTICVATSTVLQATNTGGTSFAWTPPAYLNDATLLNPTATPPVTTKFYLTATNAQGCSRIDSVTITVRTVNNFTISPPDNVCKNSTIQLNATGGDEYIWQPNPTLSNLLIADPFASPQTTSAYSVLINDTLCNFSNTLSTVITVIPLPVVNANKSNDIDCSSNQSNLTATGAAKYSWSPGGTLTTTNSSNPVASPATTTNYIVKGTDLSGCINYDSVTVKVTTDNIGGYLMPSAFTPNNDGKNDCYGIKYWGAIQELEFSIYNRWGQRLFFTRNPASCWDGKFKGVQQNPDVFIYMIKAKTRCTPFVFRKGTFALIR
jgi:gliding motility-associated-like protein